MPMIYHQTKKEAEGEGNIPVIDELSLTLALGVQAMAHIQMVPRPLLVKTQHLNVNAMVNGKLMENEQ